MVVQDRQWVATSTTADRDMPLEVHLPQLVGPLVLEALIRLVLETLRWLDKLMSSEDVKGGVIMDRRGGVER